jgi:putative membrane protein insertion efficiency factor
MVSPRLPAIPLLAIVFLLLIFTPVHSDDWNNLHLIEDSRGNSDPPVQAEKSRLELSDSTSELEMGGLVLLRLYQVVLSSQDGPRCMFHPSCSEYAKQALTERGWVVGTLLAVDRYLRCNGVDRELYPYDPIRRKLLDPVPAKKSEQGPQGWR